MDIRGLLPIGSVVLLKEGKKKLMIFGVKQMDSEVREEYDYIGVMYPEGNVGIESQYLFNHENIDQIFFRGYEDEERERFIDALDEYYAENHK